MNDYIFEITQVLKKEIKIKARNEAHAENEIVEMFENGDIRLNQDNCVQSGIKIIKSEDDNQPGLFDE